MKSTILKLLTPLALVNMAWAQELTSAQNQLLKNAKEGEIIRLDNFLTTTFQEISYQKRTLPSPQFIISDDPEYIRVPEAIAMQEQVEPGAVRLYVYNVNGVAQPEKITRKISAVIKNTGTQDLHIRMLKYASQKPSTNYFKIGKQGLADYFTSQSSKEIRTIKPGEVLSIDPAMDKHLVQYDELVHGFYEFTVDQPAEISVIQYSPEKSVQQAYKTVKNVIPHSHVNAGRGLFPISNYGITNTEVLDTKNGVTQLVVADGKNDQWIEGSIGEAKEYAKNAGNYGVMYKTKLRWKSTDGKALALVTWNSRSADNQWCGGMGLTMQINQQGKVNTLQLPNQSLITKAAPEAIFVQLFKPDPTKEIQEIEFVYSPPGASCLPTPLVFIPVDIK